MAETGSGRSIFITGAASGIGRETALLFADRGWRVGAYDLDRTGSHPIQQQHPQNSNQEQEQTQRQNRLPTEYFHVHSGRNRR